MRFRSLIDRAEFFAPRRAGAFHPTPLKGALFVASLCLLLAHPATASTLAVQWNDVLLQCVRLSKIGPPMVARAIGVTHTCGFDAWAMYDDVAVSTRVGDGLRRPPSERTQANKEKAYSYAEYRALLDLFPAQADFIRSQMTAFGYDPDDLSTDTTTPQGIGNVCAAAVLEFRHTDGSNQLGDLHPGAYSDYTGYAPVNTLDQILDPNHWQPLRFCDGQGGFVSPSYVAPQWENVVPFALSSWDQFPVPAPARYPDGGYTAQAEEILRLNAKLSDRDKMIVEYWADGPRSELPPGHFTLFAEFVSERDHHTFDDDAKMFFILGNAEMDAGIAVWGNKREYDSERPITAIHFLKSGKRVLAYVPFQGPKVIYGEDWMPYQPCSFVTPPFPEYPSGHSAFSAAGAEILKRFTGSDAFGGSVTLLAGSGRAEPGFAPSRDVTLSWPTFSDAANEAGMSRRLGGIHFKQGDLESRKLGREVAAVVWDRAQTYIDGSAGQSLAQAAKTGAPTSPQRARALQGSGAQQLSMSTISPGGASGDGARIEFFLPEAARIRLSVFDVRGRRIAVLAEGMSPAGRQSVTWSPTRGAIPSGIYFAQLTAGQETLNQRIVMIH